MSAAQLTEWVNHCQELAGYWYAKRLSGNDTQATGSHQAGPYIPNADAFQIFPELHDPAQENPRVDFHIVSVSHEHTARANIIWYNNQLRGRTRNETRITGLGGIESPLLDPENTGAIALFFFTGKNGARECRYWVCQDVPEENEAETFVGPVEPGRPLFWATLVNILPAVEDAPAQDGCWLTAEQVTVEWEGKFPTPQEVLEKAISLQSYRHLPVDSRLMGRRDCEYDVFRSVERAIELPAILEGFNSVDSFVNRANTILQRRKARSGRSLELHIKAILSEEKITCQPQARTEADNRPDFIFPSQEAYNDPAYPSDRLRACLQSLQD